MYQLLILHNYLLVAFYRSLLRKSTDWEIGVPSGSDFPLSCLHGAPLACMHTLLFLLFFCRAPRRRLWIRQSTILTLFLGLHRSLNGSAVEGRNSVSRIIHNIMHHHTNQPTQLGLLIHPHSNYFGKLWFQLIYHNNDPNRASILLSA